MRKTISSLLCSASFLSLTAAMAQQPGASTTPGLVPTTVPQPPEPGSVLPPPVTGAPAVGYQANTPPPAIPAAASGAPAAGYASPVPAPGNPPISAPPAEPPAPIEPPTGGSALPGMAPSPASGTAAAVDQAALAVPTATGTAGTAGTAEFAPPSVGRLNEFQGDDVAQVLQLLARQAKISLVVSDHVSEAAPPMKVTMRLEDKTPMQAIKIICFDKGLVLLEKEGVYYVKTKEEKEAEPTESAAYTFSYGSAEKALPLLAAQLESKVAPQFDPRTNTVFYREVGSNMDAIKLFLQTIDEPTKQVMIEARLLEVTANPQQSYGFNWGGIFGNSSSPQTFTYGGSNNSGSTFSGASAGGNSNFPVAGQGTVGASTNNTLTAGSNLFGNAGNLLLGGNGSDFLRALGGQFAILSIPQMQLTMRFLNEDADAELLANPRLVTANNQQATIKITRNQPVPSLNFNEQTAQAVFGGFTDKNYGNTLIVTPSINKDSFVTLNVKPEISNKVADSVFTFQGATVSSPIIDTRDIESTVLIKSGDTLAIGGLLQDEVAKTHNKVPVLGDIPVLGYAFQEHLNARTKRNLLIFVTPTIIHQGYGTGLEDQISGLHHSGEEYADPNGWRNNARGAYRLVPTSNRQIAADYPKPGIPIAPAIDTNAGSVDYTSSAQGK